MMSAGKLLREALSTSKPLQIVGALNAYHAIMAEYAGSKALHLSVAGVAAQSHGLPDLGIVSLSDMVEDTRRVVHASKLPVLVDIGTGFGNALNIRHAVQGMEAAGAAGVHIEDVLVGAAGGKSLVTAEEMVDRISAAVQAKRNPDFVIMAKTAASIYAPAQLLERVKAYVEAGADSILSSGVLQLDQYKTLASSLPNTPVLANLDETIELSPIFTAKQLAEVGIAGVVYPLSAFSAANKAALTVFETIHKEGTQAAATAIMQPRDQLYNILNYNSYEKAVDELLAVQTKHK